MKTQFYALVLVVLLGCGGSGPAVIETQAPATNQAQAISEEPSSPDPPAPETHGAEATPGTRYTETIPGTEVTFQMGYVPTGSFVMGSPDDEAGRDDDEGPQHSVAVDGFWMGTHEVTYDAYALFRFKDRDSEATAVAGEALDVDAIARPSPPYEDPAHGMGDWGYPAVGMTQWGALQFARWLSEKTGKLYRLPTEAEWEYACRAGTTTAYPFGDHPGTLGDYAWYYRNSDEVFHPVGQKEPNAWGLYDLHGNVAEWTMDQYDPEFYASLLDGAENPYAAPTRLHPRTVRGGAYDDDAEDLRCAARLRSNLDWKRRDPQLPKSFWWNTDSPFVGFRLVRPSREMTMEEIRAYWAEALNE